jgi:hypothetical protein
MNKAVCLWQPPLCSSEYGCLDQPPDYKKLEGGSVKTENESNWER